MDGRRRGKLLQSMSFYKQTTESSESWSQESQSKIPLAFMGPKAKAWWTPVLQHTFVLQHTSVAPTGQAMPTKPKALPLLYRTFETFHGRMKAYDFHECIRHLD